LLLILTYFISRHKPRGKYEIQLNGTNDISRNMLLTVSLMMTL